MYIVSRNLPKAKVQLGDNNRADVRLIFPDGEELQLANITEAVSIRAEAGTGHPEMEIRLSVAGVEIESEVALSIALSVLEHSGIEIVGEEFDDE